MRRGEDMKPQQKVPILFFLAESVFRVDAWPANFPSAAEPDRSGRQTAAIVPLNDGLNDLPLRLIRIELNFGELFGPPKARFL